MEIIWLGIQHPSLQRAAAWLVDSAGGASADLQRTVCVVPGRRAGRTLLADLVAEAAGAGVLLVPPTVITPGAMAEVLLDLDARLATADERVLAWTAVLRESDPGRLAPLLTQRPEPDDVVGWMTLARSVARVHEELAGERLDLADALSKADRREADRWRLLVELHDRYERRLDALGLADPATAFADALARGRARDDVHVVLVGVPDLNGRQRAVVETLGPRCVALTFADAADADRFDALGCVDPGAWAEAPLVVDDERLVVADRPVDQAQAVLERLAQLGGALGPEAITVGMGDESLAEPLLHAGVWAGVAFHHASGRPLRRSGPCRLLDLLAGWMDERSPHRLAALLRHPDLERWLREPVALVPALAPSAAAADPIGALDRYRSERLAVAVPDANEARDDRERDVAALAARLDGLLAPLAGAPRPLAAWCDGVLAVLREAYRPAERDGASTPEAAATVEACAAFRDVALGLSRIDAGLQPDVDGAAAMSIVLSSAATHAAPGEPAPEQVEMLGWLEVALDPAPVLVLTGVNDGAIPGTVGVDPLLPERLRRALGVRHEERRYARDAYWLDLVTRGGRDVTLVAGRRGPAGDPLAPSRLLIAADPTRLVERVERFCRPPDRGGTVAARGLAAASSSSFRVPELPADLPLPDAMRVTDFKLYLQCPYRYALQRLLRLERVEDDADEMTPLQFGSLAHEVLEAFGRDPEARGELDPAMIEAFLHDELHRRARRRFGASPLPAAAVQLARLRQRLTAFAVCQAQLRREGWAIRHCEIPFKGTPALPVEGQDPMPLRGTIDRIDVHEPTGRWRVIDYKTGESGDDPVKTHHGSSRAFGPPPCRWFDLQLPLYRHLVVAGGPRLHGEIELGYIVLPRQVESVGFRPAPWDEAQITDGLRRAAEIVRDIRARRFELDRDRAAPFDPYARICQTPALGLHEKDDAA